jgi:hypothetical protein
MKTKTLHFIRHYVEMVLAMFVGMAVLGGGLAALGLTDWTDEAPALHLLWMAFTMSAPMVAWMLHRGHGWAPALEMTAAMFVPSAAAIVLFWTGATEDTGTLMAIQHSAMFPAMLVAMLLRLDEYTGGAGRTLAPSSTQSTTYPKASSSSRR